MLNQLRSHATGFLAKILLAFLVLSFGIWGVGDMLRHPGSGRTVATVGGSTITIEEFARALRRDTDNLRRAMGDDLPPEMLKNMHLPQQVLRELVSHRLIQLESAALGLVPSDAEVVRHIRSSPVFQDSQGHFDKNLFQAVLHNSGQSEQNYVEQQRQQMASSLLTDTIMTAIPTLPDVDKTLYNEREEHRGITLYVLSPALVSDVSDPTASQLESFYKDNAKAFTVPEYRTVSYVVFTAKDATAKAASDTELKSAYQERAEEFKRPERRVVEQLLYGSEEKAKAAEAMLKNGKSIAQVAKATDILNKNGVDMGEVDKTGLIKEAAEPVFALPSGGFTAPLQSAFGWHIFQVSKIEPPSVAPFEEARPMLEKELKQRNADDALNHMANQLQDALAGGASLKEAAGDLKLTTHALGPLDARGNTPDGAKAKDIPDLDKFLDTAFKTEEKGDSSLVTSKDGNYYLLHVDSVTPEHARPLSEVKAQAVLLWQKAEREKHLGLLAKDIATKFSTNAQGAISQYKLQPAASASIKRDGATAGNIALPQSLVAEVFVRRPGESTGAYPLKDGDYALAVVNNITAAAPPGKDALAKIHTTLQANIQTEIMEQYLQSLAKKYSVSVNEAALSSVGQ